MKIAFSPYNLKAKKGNITREGALLRVDFEEGIGYADCHPWHEHGDLPLKEQLALLAKGKLTRQTTQSIKFAKIDAKARSEGLSLFRNLTIPPSHWLLSKIDEQLPKDFSLVKLKLGFDPAEELANLSTFLESLPSGCKARLDFNSRVDEKGFRQYIPVLEKWRKKIDFIEDPYSFDAISWEGIQTTTGLKLALDRDSERHADSKYSHSVVVVKPAIQEAAWLCSVVPQQVVITSYLDHPLGQAAAAYSAALLSRSYPEKLLPCGLLSHGFYQTNKYSERLSIHDERLILPEAGTGFGFDDLLTQEHWRAL